MTPCAHVLSRHDLGTLRYGQRQRHGDVVGSLFPLGAHVFPVHLAYVGIRLRPVDHRIIELDDATVVGGIEEHIHAVLRRVERVGIFPRPARFAPAEHERLARQRRPIAHHRAIGIDVRHTHAVDLEGSVLRKPVEGPPHRGEIAVEIERALLGHLQRAVGFHLGLDIHLRHGVRFRVSLPGSQRHKRACERQERRAKQHGVSSGKSEGFAELRTAHVLHDHAPCNLEVVTVS